MRREIQPHVRTGMLCLWLGQLAIVPNHAGRFNLPWQSADCSHTVKECGRDWRTSSIRAADNEHESHSASINHMPCAVSREMLFTPAGRYVTSILKWKWACWVGYFGGRAPSGRRRNTQPNEPFFSDLI